MVIYITIITVRLIPYQTYKINPDKRRRPTWAYYLETNIYFYHFIDQLTPLSPSYNVLVNNRSVVIDYGPAVVEIHTTREMKYSFIALQL